MQNGTIYGINKTCNANFGINVSNIPVAMLAEIGVKLGEMVHLTVSHNGKVHFDEDVLYHRSFGYVAPGEPICYNAEGMLLGFALGMGCQGFWYGDALAGFMPFVIAGVFYYIMNSVVAFVMAFIEKRLNYYR